MSSDSVDRYGNLMARYGNVGDLRNMSCILIGVSWDDICLSRNSLTTRPKIPLSESYEP